MRSITISWLAMLSTLLSPEARAAELEILVQPVVAGNPLIMDSLRYAKVSGESFSVSRLSYLISGVELETEDGSWEQCAMEAAWLDAGKRGDNFVVRLNSGVYRAVRFSVGLEKTVNHAKPNYPAGHPLNPAVSNLHWNWQGGYIFMALEGHYRSVGQDDYAGFVLHFARDHNRTVINLPVKINLMDRARILIDFDIAALLDAPKPITFGKDGDSTHSKDGDLLAEALKTNLPAAFRVKQILTLAASGTKPKLAPLYLPSNPKAYPLKLASTFPLPELPMDNPLLVSRVLLGKTLFEDSLLSRTGNVSCSSCHQADRAFTDVRTLSLGVEDRLGTRNSMPLFNLAWKEKFFWDGRASSLREQVLKPIQDHSEMDESLEKLTRKLSADSRYPAMFRNAFGEKGITAETISLALENFLLTLTSYDSKFDRAMKGKAQLNAKEQRGFELFMTEFEPRANSFGADCFHCHGGALFSDHGFHNNGLSLENGDRGLAAVTKKETDTGKFSTPSLRNVELTAPYMHDGRMKTLEDVVAHYSSGVERTATLDPNLAKHPKSGIGLSKDDQAALVAFLKTLTDGQYQASKTSS